MSLSVPDMPSGDVDVSLSAPDMQSGDVDASVSVPDMPSVDVKAPKKSLLGKLLKKKSSKASVAVSQHQLRAIFKYWFDSLEFCDVYHPRLLLFSIFLDLCIFHLW